MALKTSHLDMIPILQSFPSVAKLKKLETFAEQINEMDLKILLSAEMFPDEREAVGRGLYRRLNSLSLHAGMDLIRSAAPHLRISQRALLTSCVSNWEGNVQYSSLNREILRFLN